MKENTLEKTGNMAELFHHCERVSYENGTWQPQRFLEKTMKFYEAIDEGKAIRAHSTAGITMEFVTEEEEIGFSYESYGFCRPFLTFDIYENDIFMQTVREPDNSRGGRIRYRRRTGPGPVHFTIYLPHCVWSGIREISFGQWKAVKPKEKKILFLGDSITQGMTVLSPSQSWPVLVSRYLQCDYINQGVGGYVFCADSLQEVTSGRQDKIFVAYGTNDYSAIRSGMLTLEGFRQNVSDYLDRLSRIMASEGIYVLTPLWRADLSGGDRESFLQVSSIIKEESGRRGIQALDGLTLVGHQESLYADGVHPNDRGAGMMALNLLRGIRKGGYEDAAGES